MGTRALSARSLFGAAFCVLLAVWGLVLLAWMMRPVYVWPKDSPPLMAVGRLDSIGGHVSCGVELRLIRVDR